MINQTGLFGWIREGVKQSVLLGVSDAMEVLGVPDETGSLHPSIANGQSVEALARNTRNRRVAQNPADTSQDGASSGATAPRKRLGKSLKDLSPAIVPKGSAAPAPKQ
jgi:hypothetical protein